MVKFIVSGTVLSSLCGVFYLILTAFRGGWYYFYYYSHFKGEEIKD